MKKIEFFKFFGIKNVKSKPRTKVYSSKKYDIYEEEIIWPSFSKRNVFKNLKQKYKKHLNLKIGLYKKTEKIKKLFHVLIQTETGKTETFTAKKVVFCMGFLIIFLNIYKIKKILNSKSTLVLK